MIKEDTIKIVVQRLVDAYSPLAIYLFGSYAWGNPTEDSDLDLLVIVNESDDKTYRRAVKGFTSLRGLRVPKDLIVSTKNEFEAFSSDKLSIFYKIREEGRKLYEYSSGLA
jgi:predicted nucleotidyltransferase